MCGWMLNCDLSEGVSLLLRFGGVWVDVKFVSFSFGCVVASKVWGVCGWMLNLFVFLSGLPLLLRFGGVWVDVKVVFFGSGGSFLLRFWGVWRDVKIVFLVRVCRCF